jgi:hypothetical protein
MHIYRFMEGIRAKLPTRITVKLSLRITYIWEIHVTLVGNGCPLPYHSLITGVLGAKQS